MRIARQVRVGRGLAIVFSESEPQLLVNALIQEDFHRMSRDSNSLQTKFLAFLQDLNGKFAADR
jgi:hypothetical protein